MSEKQKRKEKPKIQKSPNKKLRNVLYLMLGMLPAIVVLLSFGILFLLSNLSCIDCVDCNMPTIDVISTENVIIETQIAETSTQNVIWQTASAETISTPNE